MIVFNVKETCSNCNNLYQLNKHPNNNGNLKGSVLSDSGLYACINSVCNCVLDNVNGRCEMWERRIKYDKYDK